MSEQNPHPDDWQEEAPLLSSLRGQQPYDAPEGYFDSLPGRIMDRIQASEGDSEIDASSPFPDSAPPKRRVWLRYSVAACFVLLIGLSSYLVIRSLGTENVVEEDLVAQVDFSTFSEEELLAEIDFSEVSDDELVSLMGDEALAAFEVDQLDEETRPILDETDLDLLSDEDLDLLNFDGFEDLEYE